LTSTVRKPDPVDARPNAPSPSPASVVLALRRSTRSVQHLLTAQAGAHGLSLPELLTLVRATDEEGVTVTAARHALGMRSSSMTALADRLERDRLLRRAPHPTDRRSTVLRATPKGRRVVERALGPIVGGVAGIVSSLKPVELATLERFLDQTADLYNELEAAIQASGSATRRAASARRRRAKKR
jgi:DNA-binding MarR family transcriptional regulator